MITHRKALEYILHNTKIKGIEKVNLKDSFNRVIAERVYSDIDIPPFNRVSMDGYAIRGKDIARLPYEVEVVATLRAGEIFNRAVKKGQVVRIMTGCALPKCFDRVIKVEDTEKLSDDRMKILQMPPERNVCNRGEDCRKGTLLIAKGDNIGVPQLSLLATAGRGALRVYKRPRVCVISTGDEIIEPDEKITFGKVRNSNAPILIALAKKFGADVEYLGIARDNIKDIRNKIRKGLQADILIISGGVSKGEFDYVPQVLKELGVKKIFHKVKIKPGKPLWFGKKKDTVVFGIPGNPAATYLSFSLFVRPAILKMQGNKDTGIEFYQGRLTQDFKVSTDRPAFHPCNVRFQGAAFLLRPLRHHSSGDMFSVSRSEGFLMLREGRYQLKKGNWVSFIRR